MKKESMTPQMKRMCSKFEVSCVGCPYDCGDRCNINNISKEEAEEKLQSWLNGEYWSSCYNIGE